MKPTAVILSAVLLAGATPLAADSPAADDMAWRIRREALEHSQILKTLHMLTDVYGPRLTGSPNLKQAGEWAAGQMKTWGLVNTHLEPWSFGHPGWLNERFSAFLVSPVKDSLVGEVLAWTPSTNGPVHAATVTLTPPDRPSADALKTYLDSVGDAVSGKIVLVGEPKVVPVDTQPPAKRLSDTDARARFDPVNPAPSPFANRVPPTPTPGVLTPAQVNEQSRRVPRRASRGRARQRRRPRARADPRVQQPHVRRRQSGADDRPAQRGLRTHLAADGRRPRGRARGQRRQPRLP